MAACSKCGWDPERKPKRIWVVQIDSSVPSTNQLGGNTKKNFKYRRWRTWFEQALKEQLNAIPRADKFRVGLITRYYGKGKRAYDYENLVGGCKPLVDTLNSYDVIVNDNPSYWRGHYDQLPSPTGVDQLRIELLEY